MEWLNVLQSHGQALLGPTVWLVLWTIIKIVVIAVPIILCVAYLTYWERKMIGAMHAWDRTAWASRGCCSPSPTCSSC